MPQGASGFNVDVLEVLHISFDNSLLFAEHSPPLLPSCVLVLLLAEGAGCTKQVEGLIPMRAHHEGGFPLPSPLLEHFHGCANRTTWLWTAARLFPHFLEWRPEFPLMFS